ncbi:MAG TPA: DUF4162 domain-containing protein, partial [Acidimicrobiia bacterium]|nr:DUF4162 domain-containing protein [Acidimicrobiia bacterium]
GELKSRVGRTVVEVGVAAEHAGEALALLEKIGTTETLDGERIGVLVDDGARASVEILRLLDAAGLPPEQLGIREPTLDDVFLQLTGRPVADGASDETTEAPA